jgi:hypothetical protein
MLNSLSFGLATAKFNHRSKGGHMARKKFFLVIDTETTQTNKVADFGAVVVDKAGNIQAQCGVLVRDFYLDREKHPLFHVKGDADPLWGQANLPARYAAYDEMLVNGSRMLATVASINQWLARVNEKYSPVATAYNKAFDWDKMRKSGIDCDMFKDSFCLWHAAAAKWGETKAFRQFVLDNHCFNNRSKTGCITLQTNAEVMARFALNQPELEDEPHTALEDALFYEVPILSRLLRVASPAVYMNARAYSYRDYQLKDCFKPK